VTRDYLSFTARREGRHGFKVRPVTPSITDRDGQPSSERLRLVDDNLSVRHLDFEIECDGCGICFQWVKMNRDGAIALNDVQHTWTYPLTNGVSYLKDAGVEVGIDPLLAFNNKRSITNARQRPAVD
jgi:hypothetical protein